MKEFVMRVSIRHLARLSTLLLVLTGFSTQVAAQALFSDDFENRVQDQALIGNNWTWFLQSYGGDTCTGVPIFLYGPYTEEPVNYPQENRNYWTASADFGQGDSYFRAGLEVPAWEGALSNMLRVYGDQYFNYATSCERVLVFQELSIASAGNLRFSFDVAKDRYGAPANGEITGAFVTILKSSDQSYVTLFNTSVITTPPPATSPDDVTTATQWIDFNIPAEYVGELLQFGFYNDVTESLGQSWATAGAYYDNVELAQAPVGPPIGPRYEGVPIPLWAFLGMAGLIAFFGASRLRSGKKA
jgi:hypothetical protein